MAADGSIAIDVNLNVSQANKKLAKLKDKIEETEKEIAKTTEKRDKAQQDSLFKAAELDSEKAKLQEIKDRLEEIRGLSKNKSVNFAQREQYKEMIPSLRQELSEQQERVRGLQSEWNRIDGDIGRYNAKIEKATQSLNQQKDEVGGLVQQINAAEAAQSRMPEAVQRAEEHMERFGKRLKGVIAYEFVFNILSAGLRQFTQWVGKAIKSSDEAGQAIANLKGALLTLAQPIVSVIIPAFVKLVNILAQVVSFIASIVSTLFGGTAAESSKAAEGLYDEMNALEGVGGAADDAAKSLAGFDEINQLSDDAGGGGGGSADKFKPNFESEGLNWLSEILGESAGWVTDALLLGGIALVAIGACMGNLPVVLAGLLLIGAGIVVGEETGVLKSWIDTLGLNNVQEFAVLAIILAGIAIIAIGAAMGNILMVLAGLGLLAAGIYVGVESKTLEDWAKVLGLNSVFDYVIVGIQLAGIALTAIGAAMANIAMVIADGVILGAGITAELIGEETLKEWWNVLKLTSVQQWVSVALLLCGIAFVAIGAAMSNILMIIAGLGMIGLGTVVAATEGNLKDWVSVLGLQKVAG